MGSKMIVVKSRGYVDTSRGRHVFTPINRPYREQTEYILAMITRNHADVYEVLPDKTEVKLDTTNYDKDNWVRAKKVTCETPKVEPISELDATGVLHIGTVKKPDKIEVQFDTSGVTEETAVDVADDPVEEPMPTDTVEESTPDEEPVEEIPVTVAPEPIVEADEPDEVSDPEPEVTTNPDQQEWKKNKKRNRHKHQNN